MFPSSPRGASSSDIQGDERICLHCFPRLAVPLNQKPSFPVITPQLNTAEHLRLAFSENGAIGEDPLSVDSPKREKVVSSVPRSRATMRTNVQDKFSAKRQQHEVVLRPHYEKLSETIPNTNSLGAERAEKSQH